MKRNAILVVLTLAAICVNNASTAAEISDMGNAKEWCDKSMLDKLEGIWEYPEDHTSVLIKRSGTDQSLYDILVIETPDTRLKAGDKIGYLRISPDPDKYEMCVFRTKKANGITQEMEKCLAQFNDKGNALLVKGRSLKFSLGSRYLLPAFWRLLKITYKDPLESLPKGLIRLYPSAKRRQPDYL